MEEEEQLYDTNKKKKSSWLYEDVEWATENEVDVSNSFEESSGDEVNRTNIVQCRHLNQDFEPHVRVVRVVPATTNL